MPAKKKDLSFIDDLGEGKEPGIKLDASQKALIEIAAEFAINVGKNLNAVDSVSSGYLIDNTIPLEPVITGKKIKIDIETASYYDFVNSGVKGWKDTSGSNSKYQFKKPTRKKGGSGQKTSKMVTSIRKWLIKEGLKTTDKSKNKVAISKRETKRQKRTFTDTSTRTAIIIAGNVRKRGLRKTGFWDKAIETLEKTIEDKVGLAAKIDIINSF